MVDLVKIRKKAKEKKKEEAAAPAPEPVVLEVAKEAAAAPARPPAASIQQPATSNQQSTTNDQPPTTNPSKLSRFLDTAGQQRAVEKKQEAETGQQLELLTFAINREQYAIAIDGVVIITPRPITRVPNADASVVGILSLRGTIVVLIDVRSRLGHPTAGAADADTRIIVVEREGENAGFIVDRVSRVIKVDAADIEPPPVVHASEQNEAVRGVFRHNDALTILLDLDKLLERGVASAVS